AGPVLPAQHGVELEALLVEARGGQRDVRLAVAVAVDRVRAPAVVADLRDDRVRRVGAEPRVEGAGARVDHLAERGVAAGGEERAGVELQAEVRRERVLEASGNREDG